LLAYVIYSNFRQPGAAVAAVVHYLDRVQGGPARQLTRVERWREEGTLLYDAATARHLELLQPQPGGEARHTLWHHLNLCVTALGARRLRVHTDDAELVVQLEGQVDVPPELIGLHLQVRAMLNAYRWSSVEWMAPEENREATAAAHGALERQPAGSDGDEVEMLPLWLSSELTAAGSRR